MSEELKAELFTAKVILVAGMSFLVLCLVIVFVMIVLAMKKRANKERVVQEFLKENRSNGQHVEHGEPHSKS